MIAPSGNKLPPKQRIRTEKKFGIKEERPIVCAHCGNLITTPENITTVDGKHIHRFRNPSGITFEIGCFSSADGCSVLDDSSGETTWFEGFRWSGCLCSNCLSHLGWFYRSGKNVFFGLILDSLVDSP
jgi:hypothetical protein